MGFVAHIHVHGIPAEGICVGDGLSFQFPLLFKRQFRKSKFIQFILPLCLCTKDVQQPALKDGLVQNFKSLDGTLRVFEMNVCKSLRLLLLRIRDDVNLLPEMISKAHSWYKKSDSVWLCYIRLFYYLYQIG